MGRGMRALFGRFGRSESGVALIEFAFTLPVMVTLYLGSIAVTQGMMVDRKVTLLTRTLGDITAQDTVVSSTDRDDTFNAGRVVLSPFDSSAAVLKMRVSSVFIKADATSCVEWSMGPTSSTWLRSPGENLDGLMPVSIRTPTSWLIMAEVQYSYTPIVGGDITGPITLNERLYMRPRESAQITSFAAPAVYPCT
jgi:Flp pilus assembly protein TadG